MEPLHDKRFTLLQHSLDFSTRMAETVLVHRIHIARSAKDRYGGRARENRQTMISLSQKGAGCSLDLSEKTIHPTLTRVFLLQEGFTVVVLCSIVVVSH